MATPVGLCQHDICPRDCASYLQRLADINRRHEVRQRGLKLCPRCGGKSHRCKTGQCRHCDTCDHAWIPKG